MNKNKKTCKNTNCNKVKQFKTNKKNSEVNNNTMRNNNNNQDFQIHVMPPQITDNDITALFNGIINVVRKKIELENKAKILNANLTLERVAKQLKEKEAECIRLKNEIIYLKAEISKKLQK